MPVQKFGFVSSCQKLQCIVLFHVTTNQSCTQRWEKSQKKSSTVTILFFMLLSDLFMLTSAHVPFYACWAFLCLSLDKLLQFILICEINEIELSWNDLFLGTVCPVGVFAPTKKLNGTFYIKQCYICRWKKETPQEKEKGMYEYHITQISHSSTGLLVEK